MMSTVRTRGANLREILVSLDPYLAILFVVPLLLLLLCSNWAFPRPGDIDPWLYYGYFSNLVLFKAVLFPNTYYGSRLSWILPGYLVDKLAPLLAGNYVLHLTFYYLAVFSLYFILKHFTDRRTALLTALLMGCYTCFLRAIGSNYVDGPAITYYLLAIALLTRAGRASSQIWTFLAGVSYAAMIYANLFCVIFSPFIVGYYLVSRMEHGSRYPVWSFARPLLAFLLGAAFVTVLLGAAEYVIAGDFLFFWPSVAHIGTTMSRPSPWKTGIGHWMPTAYYLVIPLITLLASGVFLARAAKSETHRSGVAYAVIFIGTLLMMIILEAQGRSLFELEYYASYLIPPMFLALGTQVGTGLKALRPASFHLLVIAFVAVVSLPLWAGGGEVGEWVSRHGPIIPLAAGMIWPAGLAMRRDSAGGLPAFLAGISICHYLLSAPDPTFATRHSGKEVFVRIMDAAQAIKTVAGDGGVRFWYDIGGKNGPEFSSLNATYLWGYSQVGLNFPSLRGDASLVSGELLVIPSVQERPLDLVTPVLKRRGLTAKLVERKEINYAGVHYWLTMAEVEGDLSSMQPVALTGDERPVGSLQLVATGSRSGLPLGYWRPCYDADPNGRMDMEPDGLHVVTPAGRWAYSTIYGPLVATSSGKYRFVLSYRLLSGAMAFGVLSADQTHWLGTATPLRRRDGQARAITIPLQSGQRFWLLTTNDHPGGDRTSRYVLEELQAYSDIARGPG